MLLGGSDALPSWAVLLAAAVTLADPRGPGDGAQDVLLSLGGVFNVFQNLSADQDLLIAVSDGMNAHTSCPM
ncbi:hypothetical protein BE20_05925 [Sorangium cellulosum]|nr:hypothetical protein BE20_05925 [Sorangium cellulosum]